MCEPHPYDRMHAFSHACCCAPMPHPMGGCCGMGPGIGFRRRFMSREERIAQLEAYLADLQAEAKAVQERLAKLRQQG